MGGNEEEEMEALTLAGVTLVTQAAFEVVSGFGECGQGVGYGSSCVNGLP